MSDRFFPRLLTIGLVLFVSASSANAQTVVRYTYDRVGRVTTALYDNGICVVYSYDANGNRTGRTVFAAGTPNTPTWGTGVYGCFNWS